MEALRDTDLPPKRILLVATVGGSTNAAPMLEIGKVLHARGHKVDYAALEGGQKVMKQHPYLNKVYSLGRNLTPEEDEMIYTRLSKFRPGTASAVNDIAWLKIYFDGFWKENYPNLKKLVSEHHYDFICSNHLCDASKDIMVEDNIPLALVWPQGPFFMAPQSWIPGDPCLQSRCLTSEHASMYDRIFEMTSFLRAVPWLAWALIATTAMRFNAGVRRMVPIPKKPDYLILINSFFGVEIPKDLPPLINCVGPILSDDFPPLDDQTRNFLESHPRTVFIALGTHVRLPFDTFERLFAGLSAALEAGEIDGVIWALGRASRSHLDLTRLAKSSNPKVASLTYREHLNNATPNMYFTEFAPQRAVLSHTNTRLFVTHCGASSAMEGVYHGVPMLTLGIYFDQITGSMRLCAAGVALPLDKFTFSPGEARSKIATIVEDEDGQFARNCLRLRRIALIASKGKERAADLIEQHMYDHELRFDDKTGRASTPMHLQTADMRMSWFKKHNLDVAGAVLVVGGLAVHLFGLVVGLRR